MESKNTQLKRVPMIDASGFASQQRGSVPRLESVNLHEQGSQTLKFCPSKEVLTTTRFGAFPPLPMRQPGANRPPNSERGLRDCG